ncbi:extensin family protein [Caulobacter sp.]|uniref:extensin-like domain-containing protein n=1 Tax=Caulobacter sp. TaxID=78 RepID=UPI003BA9DF44
MAYRVPRHPRIEHHARRQTRLARLTGLALLWLLVLVMAFVAQRVIPDQHLPWKPLSIIDPVGMATRLKAARAGADPRQCRAILAQAGVSFAEVPDRVEGEGGLCHIRDALRVESGMAKLSPADAPLACKEALALILWERQVVQPAADELLGRSVVGLDHYGSYACRRMYGKAEGPVSEHASAAAIDIAAFRLADGQTVSVASDWTDPGPRGQFLRRVRDGACRVFQTTLGPDYNAEHRDHFHLDMSGGNLCA